MSRFNRFFVSSLVIAISLSPYLNRANANPTAPLTATAFDSGINAASSGDWVSAKEHFYHALSNDPSDSKSIFNLGLVYSNLGEELVAAAWFTTYLKYNSSTPKGDIIARSIEELFSDAEIKIRELLLQAEISADLLVSSESEYDEEPIRKKAYLSLAQSYSTAGWYEEAASFWRRYDRYDFLNKKNDPNRMLELRYMGLIKGEDFSAAKETLQDISDSKMKRDLLAYIPRELRRGPLSWLGDMFATRSNKGQLMSGVNWIDDIEVMMRTPEISNTTEVLKLIKAWPAKQIPVRMTLLADRWIEELIKWRHRYNSLDFHEKGRIGDVLS